MARTAAIVCCVMTGAVGALGQSLTVKDKLTLSVTRIERVMERRVGGGTERPEKGKEFAKLTLAPKLLTGAGDPCAFSSGVALVLAGDYQLFDASERKVLGMDVTVSGSGPCETYTVLFQPSAVGTAFRKLRFKGAEADLSSVPGAQPAAAARP